MIRCAQQGIVHKLVFITLTILLMSEIGFRYTTNKNITPPALLYIPNADTNTIMTALRDQGLTLTLLNYRLMRHYEKPTEGWIRYDTNQVMTHKTLIASLNKRSREATRRLVMYGGSTIENFSHMLSEQTGLSPGALAKSYHHHSSYHEGGIMAGFYQIPYRTTASATLYHMVSQSEGIYRSLSEEYLSGYDTNTWKRILTIASIIQKETHIGYEMPRIASVIYNRLDRGMKLQMDATLNYGKYSHTIVTPERIRSDSTHYNTYRHYGIPKEPIGSVTKEALVATLEPAKSDYLYFMRNQHGTHDFSADYNEHLANIQKRRREQNLSSN